MNTLTPFTLPSLAITAGASTPSAPVGTLIWSTQTPAQLMYYNGSAWVAVSGGGGSGVTSVTATGNLSSSGGATPAIALTATPSFQSVTVTGQFNGSGAGFTSGTIPNAALVTPDVTAVTASGNLTATPTTSSGSTSVAIAMTATPTFMNVTSGVFSGSGAGLTNGSIPNAALVTTPVTSVGVSGNITSSGGATTPTIGMTATPSFTSVNLTGAYQQSGATILTALLGSGSNNLAAGPTALASLTTGANNAALGYGAGRYIADGASANSASANSIFLGYSTKPLAASDAYEIVIGANLTGIGSNSIAIGGSGTPGFYAGTGAPTFSAPNGSQYLRFDGALTYVNTSGASTAGTTWTATSTTGGSGVTAVTASGNLSSSGTTSVAIAMTATPSFTSVNTTGAYMQGGSTILTTAPGTGGTNNFAAGAGALAANTTGGTNAAFGVSALSSNTTASNNAAFGYNALKANTTGANNAAFGYTALGNSAGASASNAAFGYQAGQYITGGSTYNTTPNNAIFLGASTKALAATDSYEIVIGAGNTGLGSNSISIGQTGTPGFYAGTGAPTFSAPNGSTYLRYDGTQTYTNTSGASTSGTTWTAGSGGGSFVDLVSAQTIAGVKTFSSPPVFSGASITNATIPNAALVTAPVTSVGVLGNITSTGGLTPTIGMLATPSFTGATVTGGLISLSNATSNMISFQPAAGVGPPTTGTSSVGTKLVLDPNAGSNAADYALGIDVSTLWSSVPNTSSAFAWYGGTTLAASLSGAGGLVLAGGLTATTGGFTSTVSANGGFIANGTAAPTLTSSVGQAAFYVSGNSLVIKGGTTASSSLFINNYNNSGYINVYCGTLTQSSDASLKENVVDTHYGLATVQKLQPRDFKWIDGGKVDVGFIAQEVQEVVPEVVTADPRGSLGVNYSGIIPVLVAAVQQLAAQFTAYVAAHP